MATNEIKKIKCSTCSGLGKSVSESKKKCAKCHGNGFLIDKSAGINTPLLCKKCDGNGTVATKTSISCKKCDGNRFFVDILKIEKGFADCYKCNDVKNNICPDCHNDGYVITKFGPIQCDCRGKFRCKICNDAKILPAIKITCIKSKFNMVGVSDVWYKDEYDYIENLVDVALKYEDAYKKYNDSVSKYNDADDDLDDWIEEEEDYPGKINYNMSIKEVYCKNTRWE